MSQALRHLWASFYVAVLLFVPAAVLATLMNAASPQCMTCGANVATTFWLIGIGAYEPILWWNPAFSSWRRFGVWVTAVLIAMGCYFGLELIAVNLLWTGSGLAAVRLGFTANLVGLIAATGVSLTLVRYTSRRIVREAMWLCGCMASAVVFVTIVISVAGAPRDGIWPSEWAVLLLGPFGVVTLLRTVIWLIKSGAHKFRYWPETALIVGVCLLAYGGSGVINDDKDTDRYLATLGAGVTATAMLFRRRASSA